MCRAWSVTSKAALRHLGLSAIPIEWLLSAREGNSPNGLRGSVSRREERRLRPKGREPWRLQPWWSQAHNRRNLWGCGLALALDKGSSNSRGTPLRSFVRQTESRPPRQGWTRKPCLRHTIWRKWADGVHDSASTT